MKTYTFYLHEGPEEIPAFEIDLFETREAAIAYGRALLAERPRYDRVVVTEEIIEIARFDRPDIDVVMRPDNDSAREGLRAAG